MAAKQLPKEFSHIEVKVFRNRSWMIPQERRMIFLSEDIPLCELELPSSWEDYGEEDLLVMTGRIIEALAKLGFKVRA